ncbi:MULTISPECIES: MBL fold metallo-hydrolase [unclassified Ruminococcus]|uniref:MBL fold metallo-hydrolase n=1 Tax=unclassified Ruminococcus TaxID=2608920 RepID=UPI00210BEAC2|nr:MULTISPECIES: MBL fold metallo-hydrolase [unclassified Ruminococcus]MCQ4021427.1 MBL fold metallo-hydrolase [Ruminococcus sp. zg-924]MCQ4113872.1 MBL fold metallo-hydrolase [Ruminococcus sp. zg-921]
MAKICPLFSGSQGNSYYISSAGNGILIDAGRSAKQIENALAANQIDIDTIRAIFVTHEHTDHIQGLRVFSSRHKIKVYASYDTMHTLEQMGVVNEKVDGNEIDSRGVAIDGMLIKPFATSHDCIGSVGYTVEMSNGVKVALATDTGIITDEIRRAITGCSAVILESNHDIGMLMNGAYPYQLKRRILSDCGHLSNDACSKLLPELVESGATRFILAHLSRDNNIPMIAENSALYELAQCGMKKNRDFTLMVAPPETCGESVII